MTTRAPGEMPTRSMHEESSQQTMDQGQHGEMPMRPMNTDEPARGEVGANAEDRSRASSSASGSGEIDAELVAYREEQAHRAQEVSNDGEMPIKDMN